MRHFFITNTFLLCFIFSACENEPKSASTVIETNIVPDTLVRTDSVPADTLSREISVLEQQFIDSGLVDIRSYDSSIRVDLKYSGQENFLFSDLYGDLDRCYLQPDVAAKLVNAQKILKKRFPYYSLIIFDGVRPRSIQYKMWDTIAVPVSERTKYVSNPKNGSLHNFGAAVDLSIIDERGIELDMGTTYDFFGELAYPREEERMIRERKLSYKQLFNRQILREVMTEAGFSSITTEWWHFNSCLRKEAFEKYRIIE